MAFVFSWLLGSPAASQNAAGATAADDENINDVGGEQSLPDDSSAAEYKSALDARENDNKIAVTMDGSDRDEGWSKDEDVELAFVDHFSLRKPSSSLRFRGADVRVYDIPNAQFVLESRKEAVKTGTANGTDGSSKTQRRGSKKTRRVVTAKHIPAAPFSVRLLRSTYTLVSVLMVMFFFVFCFNVVLSLFLNIPSLSGVTTGGTLKLSQLVATVFAIPLLVHGMASLMALGTAFVGDVWRGGTLLRSSTGLSRLWSEWAFFVVFLGVPSFAIAVTLFAGRENWWEISANVWMVCVFLGFAAFAAAVTYREISSCFSLLRVAAQRDENAGSGGGRSAAHLLRPTSTNGPSQRWWKLFLRAVLAAQTRRFGATIDERYVVAGSCREPEGGYALSPDHEPVERKRTLYARLVAASCCTSSCGGRLRSAFERLNPPVRLYGAAEIFDVLPYITAQSWSLLSGCCADRSRNSRRVTAARGPSAVGDARMRHTVYCIAVGVILVALLIIGFAVWMDMGAAFVGVVAVVCLVYCFFPMTNDARHMLGLYRKIQRSGDDFDGRRGGDGDDEDDTLLQVWESIRVARPRLWYCYARFVVDIVLLFLWPFIDFLANGNWKMALVFLAVGVVPLVRYYLDPYVILTEMGPLKDIDLSTLHHQELAEAKQRGEERDEEDENVEYDYKVCVSEIIGGISHNRAVHRWVWVFIVTVVAIAILILMAVGDEEVEPNNRPPLHFVEDFYYEPIGNLYYPTCEIAKSSGFPQQMRELPNYALLSALAYEWANVTESVLDQWFEPGSVQDEEKLVRNFRAEKGNSNVPVWFKLYTFPSAPGTGLVAIRGSETNWDWLVNTQTWASSGLATVVGLVIPFGWIWQPILDDLVAIVDTVTSHSIEEVAYYKVVADFVNTLLEGDDFHSLRVTGASLGGGMAIIVGAQTPANAIAISGPSAVLNRHTLDPPVTMDQLNTKTFDVVPERDIIANLGGRSLVFQDVECRAPKNSMFACHSMWRSVCELSYSCGTVGHAVFCRCVNDFGYPLPVQNGTRTFEEACPKEED